MKNTSSPSSIGRKLITKNMLPKKMSFKELSRWYLLSNVPYEVSSETLALWYYWRWNIESYFKLLKSGGQQLEHWQQESGLAVLKRFGCIDGVFGRMEFAAE
jgi:hypothetical protein